MNELTWFLIAIAIGAGAVIYFLKHYKAIDERKASDAFNEIIEEAKAKFK